MGTVDASGCIHIDVEEFAKRALKYKLASLYPLKAEGEIGKMVEVLNSYCKTNGPGIKETVAAMKKLGAPEFNGARLKETSFIIGTAMFGLGGDMEEPGSERLVHWSF